MGDSKEETLLATAFTNVQCLFFGGGGCFGWGFFGFLGFFR